MYYIIYETTNLLNNKKYRGLHKCKSLDDGYLGSGKAFSDALKKYGKENFKREILEFCNDRDHMIEREKFWVDKNWVKRQDTYNMIQGGQIYSCGSTIGRKISKETKAKISKTLTGVKHTPERIEKMASKKRGKSPWNKGVPMTDIQKAKVSAGRKGKSGKLPSDFGLKMKEAAKRRNPEQYKLSAKTKAFVRHIYKIAPKLEKLLGWG